MGWDGVLKPKELAIRKNLLPIVRYVISQVIKVLNSNKYGRNQDRVPPRDCEQGDERARERKPPCEKVIESKVKAQPDIVYVTRNKKERGVLVGVRVKPLISVSSRSRGGS